MAVLRIKGAPGESEARKELRFPLKAGMDLSAGHAAALRAIGLFLPECVFSSDEKALIREIADPDFEGEKHRIRITEDGIDVFCGSYSGLVRALSSLSLIAKVSDGVLVLPECDFTDAPVLPHRGVMLDIGRGVRDFGELTAHVVMIAKAGFNVLHLHLADSQGVGYKSRVLPDGAAFPDAYSYEQIKRLVSLAEDLALEIVPEFDMPGHSGTLLKALPWLACNVDGKAPDKLSKWTVCPGREETFALYDALIGEITQLFPGRFFHTGGDELEFADAPQLDQFCHWSECSMCRARMEKEGLKDRQELYYYFTRRIRELVKKRSRTMIMWSDQIDCMRPAGIPTDVVMQFWRVAARGRGPKEGCSMNAQLKMGYKIINSYYPQTYVDIDSYMNPEKLSVWHWTNDPECEPDLAGGIVGSELCAWEYGNVSEYPHYTLTLPPAFFLFGDKLWNGEKMEYTAAYRADLTRAIFGAGVPDGLDVFAAVGDVLPPRKKDGRIYPEKITARKDELEKIENALCSLAAKGDFTASAYALAARDAIDAPGSPANREV